MTAKDQERMAELGLEIAELNTKLAELYGTRAVLVEEREKLRWREFQERLRNEGYV